MRRRILVPVSGGKDSQACLKLAKATAPDADIEGLFCDTKFEHPKTYAHVQWLTLLYGVQIHAVCAGSVEDKVLKYERFPSFAARHCTDELKIIPTKKFLLEYALTGPVEVWYGMRSAESAARNTRYSKFAPGGLYPPHEVLPRKYPKYLSDLGVSFRLPVLHWSDDEIFDYLAGEENPLYDEGFDRVGCFPCLAAGKKWKTKAFDHDDFGREQAKKVIWLQEKIGKSVMGNNEAPYNYEGCVTCSI